MTPRPCLSSGFNNTLSFVRAKQRHMQVRQISSFDHPYRRSRAACERGRPAAHLTVFKRSAVTAGCIISRSCEIVLKEGR
jgi:hypothetical protein